MSDFKRRRLQLSVASAVIIAACASSSAQASFLSGDTLDSAANVLAWAVLFMVPVIGITVFWLVHVLPEKIAHKNHHPQRQAIQTLCLLSLVFGGMLWPIAWLWAYTRPVIHKSAYGTDKHEDYFAEQKEKTGKDELLDHELDRLKVELDAMEARAALPADLRKLRDDINARRGAASTATGRSA